MLLAGIILIIAFTATAYTLATVSDLKSQTAREQKPGLLSDYRFIHGHIRETIEKGLVPGMTNESFTIMLGKTDEDLRRVAGSRGHELSITLDGEAEDRLAGLTNPPSYDGLASYEGEPLSGPFDGTSDGLIWLGGPGGRLQAAVLLVYVSDDQAHLRESLIIMIEP